jgi:hypothetical protein
MVAVAVNAWEGRDREVRRSRVVILPAVRAVSSESFLLSLVYSRNVTNVDVQGK